MTDNDRDALTWRLLEGARPYADRANAEHAAERARRYLEGVHVRVREQTSYLGPEPRRPYYVLEVAAAR